MRDLVLWAAFVTSLGTMSGCDRAKPEAQPAGPTASKSAADRFYHKVGLYRDRWKQPMTMYVDNYTLGESFEAVDPARFDQRR
jgi:hypothetical protein